MLTAMLRVVMIVLAVQFLEAFKITTFKPYHETVIINYYNNTNIIIIIIVNNIIIIIFNFIMALASLNYYIIVGRRLIKPSD